MNDGTYFIKDREFSVGMRRESGDPISVRNTLFQSEIGRPKMPVTDMLPSRDSQASPGFIDHGRTYRRHLQLASSVLTEPAGLGLTTKAYPISARNRVRPKCV